MTDSIVVVRLTRNLRYKLTYVKIFESFLESEPGPAVSDLLNSLIVAQHSAIAPLSRYLRQHSVQTQEIELDEKLLQHAAERDNVKAQMRFICDGLKRAVSWYRTQLMDKQMVSDPELRDLLFELGEADAAKLWRTEAIMAMLRISTAVKEKTWKDPKPTRSQPEPEWQPRLVEDVGHSDWENRWRSKWQNPDRYRREG
jgi:Arc/MetJ family transcription regulator